MLQPSPGNIATKNSAQNSSEKYAVLSQHSAQGANNSSPNSSRPSLHSPRTSVNYGPRSVNGHAHNAVDFVRLFYRDSKILLKWPKPIENAPELKILEKRDSLYDRGNCLSSFCRAICKGFGKVGNSGLGPLKPVRSRTHKTIEFVKATASEYEMNLRYGQQDPDEESNMQSSKKPNKRDVPVSKAQIFKEVYGKSVRALTIVHHCIMTVKTLIYSLTFTRYVKDPLTEGELSKTSGRSILGSYVWIVTCALYQLQEDPDIEYIESLTRPNSDLTEIASGLKSLVHIIEHAWHDLLHTLLVIQRYRRRAEDIFNEKIISIQEQYKQHPEKMEFMQEHTKFMFERMVASVDFRNFKPPDPYADLLTWTNKRQGNVMPRILMINEYNTDEDILWSGFDPLPVHKKLAHLKEVLHFMNLILDEARSNMRKLVHDLQGSIPADMIPAHHANEGRRRFSAGISLEDAIHSLEITLEKESSKIEWSSDEILEFFELHKIFTDDLDILALGGAVARVILHDARHTIRVCYEWCRVMDYKELIMLPSYKKIHTRLKEDEASRERSATQVKEKTAPVKAKRKASLTTLGQYDTDMALPELRNVGGLFRTSIYRAILQDVPVFTNRLGLTLQEPDTVFSGSSTKLLS